MTRNDLILPRKKYIIWIKLESNGSRGLFIQCKDYGVLWLFSKD